jgi:BirA family biotin operon repressor/biotin-[acetyl-CoA-carboxylase] ligase
MDEAQYMIEKGCENGLLVVSEEQTDGRGRQKRKWLSPRGVNIYASLVYKPHNMSAVKSIKLMFAASIAIVEALSDFGIDNAKIKWPNDVTINGKKIAGVLVETKSESGILKSAVIGFGVNANIESIPDEIMGSATSIYLELKQKIDRAQLLVNILYYLENLVRLIESDNDAEILEMWKKYDTTISKSVLVLSGDERIKGIAEGIDENGFLLVKTDRGEIKRVVTADSVRFLYEE